MNYQIGIVGLAVMGKGLALHLAECGFSVAGYNREPEQTAEFVTCGTDSGYQVGGFASCRDMCRALERPRRLLLMVRAGAAVDAVLEELIPCLEPGDVVVDGGNSHFRDTQRRQERCAAFGIRFLGMGVSGGEKGAREGAAFMLGGDREAYELVAPFFTAAAARVEGQPCCAYVGPAGAGHFVKAVHNGIEYGDMQLICEVYYGMRHLLGMSNTEIAQQFRLWNQGELSSYLTEITADILSVTDPETGRPMVECVSGVAESKGTGAWVGQAALELGVAVPTIVQAVFARSMSARLSERRAAAELYLHTPSAVQKEGNPDLDVIRRGFYAARLCTYAQGFALLKGASQAWEWNLRLDQIAELFRGGCIIRAQFLQQIAQAYRQNAQLENLLLSPLFAQKLQDDQQSLRQMVEVYARAGLAAPALSSALAYFDGYRDAQGPLNLLQAQRDCFGAHTFKRVDRPGTFHISWKREE